MATSTKQRALAYVRALKGWALKQNVIDRYGVETFDLLINEKLVEVNKHRRVKITDDGVDTLCMEEI